MLISIDEDFQTSPSCLEMIPKKKLPDKPFSETSRPVKLVLMPVRETCL